MLQKKYEDYMDKVYSKYSDVEKESIKDIIEYGLKKLYSHIKEGNDIFMRVREEFLFIGISGKESSDKWVSSKLREHRKLRRLFIDRKEIWDGFHYFSLTKEEYQILQEQPITVSLYKIKKECTIRKDIKYVFKIDLKYTVAANEVLWREEKEVSFDQVELVETRV